MKPAHCLPLRRCFLPALFALCLGPAIPGLRAADSDRPSPAPPSAIRLEAEAGQRSGNVSVASAGGGYSGPGYVTGFRDDADRVTLFFTAHAGLYELTIRYRAGARGFVCEVNGLALSGTFDDSKGAFADQHFGKVELREGRNTIAIHGGWKYYDIDRVDLSPVSAPLALRKPPATLCDPKATPAARALMEYLVGQYGERTLSGAIQGPDVDYLRDTTGRLPAIIAADLMDVTTASVRNMGFAPDPADPMVARAREGHILSFSWHWRSPTGLRDTILTRPDGTKQDARWYLGFYAHATTFDLEAVLAHPNGPDYALLLADIDMIAGEMGKLAAPGIPVLWRPLHEAEGRWFWWGAKGPKPFIELWRLLYDRLTRIHGLHNLIWVYTGSGDPDWYPGDDVVDILGIDAYPPDVRDPLSAAWDAAQARFGGRKLVALTEFGGVPDPEAARRLGVAWSYFASWSSDLGPRKMDAETLKRIYADPRVINLDGLPRNRWAPVTPPAQ